MTILTRITDVSAAQIAMQKIEEMIKKYVKITPGREREIERKLKDIRVILGISTEANQREKYDPASEKLAEASRIIKGEVICVILIGGTMHGKPGYGFWKEFKEFTKKLKLAIVG